MRRCVTDDSIFLPITRQDISRRARFDPTGKLRMKSADLGEELQKAFSDAYPELPAEKARHMARNLAQVVAGVIDIGMRIEDAGITHMDVANTVIYWCVTNSYLEDIASGRREPGPTGAGAEGLSEEEMSRLMREFAARAADILVCLEVLSRHPDLYRAFIRGSLSIGASSWEGDRGKLET